MTTTDEMMVWLDEHARWASEQSDKHALSKHYSDAAYFDAVHDAYVSALTWLQEKEGRE